MKPFAAPSLSIEAPDDWADVTTYALLGPAAGESRVTLVVAIAKNVIDNNIAAYVDRQLLDLQKFPGYALEKRTPAKIKLFDATVIEFKWKQPAGPMIRQRQYYIWVERTVYTLTATAPLAHFAPFSDLFDNILKTFTPKTW